MVVKEGVDVRVGDGCECQRLRWSLERKTTEREQGFFFVFLVFFLFS